MKNFKLKALAGWLPLDFDEIIEFEGGSSGRTVRLDANATDVVQLYVANNADMDGEVLWGASDGMFTLEASFRGSLYVRVTSREDQARLFIRSNVPDQRVRRMSEEIYTTIEKRAARNPALERMMWEAKMNEERRNSILQQEIEKLRTAATIVPAAPSEPLAIDPPVVDDTPPAAGEE